VKSGVTFFIGAQDAILPTYKPETIIVHPAGGKVIPARGGRKIQPTDDKTGGDCICR